VRAFWVRWEAVSDLFDSDSDDRHFTVDAVDGEISFGDGARGRIPPRGTNNVRASYQTGGGAAGNVPAGAVSALKSGLPFVEAVTNPAPGAGGADTESTESVLQRAPQTLRSRGRAVVPADYERLAAEASRRIVRTRCVPAMNQAGDRETGYVTVLVVPQESGERPVPTVGLIDRVESHLAEHAPASVVAGGRLVVRGPSYVSVGVEADVVAGDVGSLNAVEEALVGAVEDFLHPLSGRGGEGWGFGELPTRSDVFALLEAVEGVDHVDSLFLTFTPSEVATVEDGDPGPVAPEIVTIGEGDARPDAPEDALVADGDHDLTVSLGGDA
jgi:predicted phage baseplate assembly protein